MSMTNTVAAMFPKTYMYDSMHAHIQSFINMYLNSLFPGVLF